MSEALQEGGAGDIGGRVHADGQREGAGALRGVALLGPLHRRDDGAALGRRGGVRSGGIAGGSGGIAGGSGIAEGNRGIAGGSGGIAGGSG
ncbi:MAG TPA: hypothetical protein VL242_24010, partial [Sorangium sp.]|nr:hypothetical protein [Sorangium sp.]